MSSIQTQQTQPPIAILGAGPGGLLLARLLELSGVEYTMFERDASAGWANGRGGSGTLDIHEGSGQTALEAAGLTDVFRKHARFGAHSKMATQDGQVQLDLDGQGRPELDRYDLRRFLLESVPEARVQWDSKVERVVEEDDGTGGKKMSVHLVGGRVERGFRLVVGADGAWSKARKLLTDVAPYYTGVHFLTSSIKPGNPNYAQAESLAGGGNYMGFGDRRVVLLMRLGDASYYSAVGLYLPEDFATTHAELMRDAAALKKWIVTEQLGDWPPVHTNLITDSDGDWRPWPLYALPPAAVPWPTRPGITLLGDAAHLTVPNGEGVNCALFDAYCLAREIIAHGVDDLPAAVLAYEKEMVPRAQEQVAGTESTLEMLFNNGGFLKHMKEDMEAEKAKSEKV